MNGVDIHQLAAAYALDALDGRERAAFEAHYTTCPACRPEVAGFRETLSQVAAASSAHPPTALKANVMAEISTVRQLSPLMPAVTDLDAFRQRRPRLLRALTIAAAIIVVATMAFVVGRRSGSSDGYAAAAATVIARTDARISDLNGAGTGSFKVVWSPSAGKAVVIGSGLSDPGPGKAYELWRIDDAGAHAVRLLDKAGGGQVHRVVAVDGSSSQWAVTVEPAAGVDTATGPVIFAGTA
jgi:anti-sigma-K factor RskA